MSYHKYFAAAVTNVESVLENRGLMFPPKSVTPLSCVYCSYMDVTGEINNDGLKLC